MKDCISDSGWKLKKTIEKELKLILLGHMLPKFLELEEI